jgi:hypothetical protein
MAATLFGESAVSRSRSGGTIDLVYTYYGTDDDAAVMTAVLADSPTTHNGLERQANDIVIAPLTVSSGSGWWTASVPYAVAQWGFQTGTDSFTFDTSGGTFHTTHSREVVASYPEDTAPDIGTTNGGPIGQNGEGIDVFVPKDEWEETHIFSWGDIDSLHATIKHLTARTNDASWRGHDAGEVIFLGARGGRLPDNTAAITFRFADGENVTGASSETPLMVGDLGPIEIRAWEYLDVHYEDVELGTGADKILAKQPKYAYIHRVYLEGDFTDLGIGS